MKKFLILMIAFGLAGCNDDSGSTSSGVGSGISTTGPTGSDFSSVAGTYKGNARATGTATNSGITLSETRSEAVTIVITSQGKVTVSAAGRSVDGHLIGNTISADQVMEYTSSDGDHCKGPVQYTATVGGGAITGTLQGSGKCTYEGIAYDVNITGNLNATRT